MDLVKELLKDDNIGVVFNVVKYMKDILGPCYNVNIKIGYKIFNIFRKKIKKKLILL